MKAVESQYPRIKIDVEKELQFYKDKRPLLLPLIADTIDYTNDAFDGGRKILVEGANATMLDIDFGTYPYVTSSNPSIGSVCTGLGVAPNKLGEIIGTVKAVSAVCSAMQCSALSLSLLARSITVYAALRTDWLTPKTTVPPLQHVYQTVLHPRGRGPLPHGASRRAGREAAVRRIAIIVPVPAPLCTHHTHILTFIFSTQQDGRRGVRHHHGPPPALRLARYPPAPLLLPGAWTHTSLYTITPVHPYMSATIARSHQHHTTRPRR